MSSQPTPPSYSTSYTRWVLALLFVIYMVNYIDRALLNIVGQAVKIDLGLSDFQLGLAAGLAFALVNGAVAIPVARLAEHRSRVAIISTALACWSIMTALCGMAQNFWQLVLARAGVGVGEAGGLAPSQSLIADYYPSERRASALAIFGAATPMGMLIGALGSGWITEHFSWRAAFIMIGLPGVLIAIVAALTIKEPPRGHSDGLSLQGPPPSLRTVLRVLAAQRTYLHMIVAGTLLNFGFFGFLTFLHPFMVRSMQMAYGRAALFYGLVTGIACGIGFVLGGFLADKLARRDRRWYLWVPGVGALLAAPAFALGFVQSDWRWAAVFLMIGAIGATLWYGPTSAVVHGLVEARMRATAIAICALVMLLFGVALGPAAVGFLSDQFGSLLAGDGCPAMSNGLMLCDRGPTNGLRPALVLISPIYLWAAAHYAIAGRHFSGVRANLPAYRSVPASYRG